MNRTVGVVPARWASTRFPGKPLAAIAGIPLVIRSLESAAELLGLENVYAATDDARIQDLVITHGFQCQLTGEHKTGTDRVAQALREISFDWAINIQGDEPTLDSTDLRLFKEVLESGSNSVLNAITRVSEKSEILSASVPKVVTDAAGRMVYISRSAIPGSKDALPTSDYRKQVGVYGYSAKALQDFAELSEKSKIETIEDIEVIRFLELGYTVGTVEFNHASVAVDWPEDVPKAEALILGKL